MVRKQVKQALSFSFLVDEGEIIADPSQCHCEEKRENSGRPLGLCSMQVVLCDSQWQLFLVVVVVVCQTVQLFLDLQ